MRASANVERRSQMKCCHVIFERMDVCSQMFQF